MDGLPGRQSLRLVSFQFLFFFPRLKQLSVEHLHQATQLESPVPQRCQGTLFPRPASRTPGASLQQPGPCLPRAGWLWALKELVAPVG